MNTDSFSHVRDIAQKLREFFNFLDINFKHIQRIHQLTRTEIEAFLSKINTIELAPSTAFSKISSVEGLFSTLLRLEWTDIPSKVLIYPEDYPKVPNAKPCLIDEYVLEQLNNHFDKLAEYIATMTMIVQECGMRVVSILMYLD